MLAGYKLTQTDKEPLYCSSSPKPLDASPDQGWVQFPMVVQISQLTSEQKAEQEGDEKSD